MNSIFLLLVVKNNNCSVLVISELRIILSNLTKRSKLYYQEVSILEVLVTLHSFWLIFPFIKFTNLFKHDNFHIKYLTN